MTANYDFWIKALKDPSEVGKSLAVHDSDLQPGFWRKKEKDGTFTPVAVWEKEGKMLAVVGVKRIRATVPEELWTYICRYPVTENAYRVCLRDGKWPDDATVRSAPAIGDNNPPADPVLALAEEIENAEKNAQAEFGEINSDEQAARAQSARSRLLELRSAADNKREELVAPHLKAQQETNKIWMPLVQKAKAAADNIRAAMSAWETKKAKAAAEAQRKAEAERQANAAKQDNPVEEEAPPAPAPTTQVRGGYGRAASVRLVLIAKVTDQNLLYPFLAGHKELSDFMAVLAQRAVNAGHKPPGVEITEERRVS
jgi:hypothetical protein